MNQQLGNLGKMYTDEMKYSRENDNFDYKLVIFNDFCDRADVLEAAKAKAYPTMLRGLALEHFYANLKTNEQILPFNHMCAATRRFFEGAEYRRGKLREWNTLTLKKVINRPENSEKSATDCLHLLIAELRHIQHGLDPDLRTQKLLYNKLISACRDMPACR